METILRKDYMDGKHTHREYYAQFVNESYIEKVSKIIGSQRILNSKDEHFNDIPLQEWDDMPVPFGTVNKIEEAGTWLTLSDKVCIAKEAAKQFKESN